MDKKKAFVTIIFVFALMTLFTYQVPPEVEYMMVGERWYVGQTKYGIELVATEDVGFFGGESKAYFNVNGTMFIFRGDSTVVLNGVKFSIEVVNIDGGYIRVKWI